MVQQRPGAPASLVAIGGCFLTILRCNIYTMWNYFQSMRYKAAIITMNSSFTKYFAKVCIFKLCPDWPGLFLHQSIFLCYLAQWVQQLQRLSQHCWPPDTCTHQRPLSTHGESPGNAFLISQTCYSDLMVGSSLLPDRGNTENECFHTTCTWPNLWFQILFNHISPYTTAPVAGVAPWSWQRICHSVQLWDTGEKV